MKILLIEICSSGKKSALEHIAGAVSKISPSFDCLLLGDVSEMTIKMAESIQGLENLWIYTSKDSKGFLSEPWIKPISELIKAEAYQGIFAQHNTQSKDFIPHLAANFDATSMTDIIDIEDKKIFKRPIYAGNAIETISFLGERLFLTLRAQAFEKAKQGKMTGKRATKEISLDLSKTQWVKAMKSNTDKPDLQTAEIVVSGGRGVGSKENFALIEQLADTLQAAIGASRAAVDQGYITNDHQVGQTGKIIAPQIYFAIGISGAIQHLAGMKESKVIVAINKDEDAPILKVADYGLVGDLFEVLPKLCAYIDKKNKN